MFGEVYVGILVCAVLIASVGILLAGIGVFSNYGVAAEERCEWRRLITHNVKLDHVATEQGFRIEEYEDQMEDLEDCLSQYVKRFGEIGDDSYPEYRPATEIPSMLKKPPGGVWPPNPMHDPDSVDETASDDLETAIKLDAMEGRR